MNDLCIDIDYSQLYKHGQKIGGDVFFLDRASGSNVTHRAVGYPLAKQTSY